MQQRKFKTRCFDLRKRCLEVFFQTGEAHLGGAFSCIEILRFLFDELKIDPLSFVMSKSHASHPFLLILQENGFCPQIRTHLEVDQKNGISCTTGSLGHGLPMAVGKALGRKRRFDCRSIFVLISDGECQEGTTWESLLLAKKFELDNLVIIVDRNGYQALGQTESILPLGDLFQKFKAFNCDVRSCHDGHDLHSLQSALDLEWIGAANGLPKVVICDTVKGRGIHFCESSEVWHAKKIREKEFEECLKALEVV